jgi:hypothetical protein
LNSTRHRFDVFDCADDDAGAKRSGAAQGCGNPRLGPDEPGGGLVHRDLGIDEAVPREPAPDLFSVQDLVFQPVLGGAGQRAGDHL